MLLLAATSCDRFSVADRVFDNSVYLDVSAFDRIQTATFSNTVDVAVKELSVKLSYPADKDISATISVDESLVPEYNSRYGTDYQMLPAAFLDFDGKTVTISAGKVSSEKVVIGFKNLMGEGDAQTGAMEIDKTWLLPITLKSNDIDVLKSSATAYYLVKRSSAITVAVQLTDDFICFPRLDDPAETELKAVYNDLTAVTYEALVYIDKYDTDNVSISTIMGVEQYLLLRIGDANFERQQLQFDGSGSGTQFGKIPSKSDASKSFPPGNGTTSPPLTTRPPASPASTSTENCSTRPKMSVLQAQVRKTASGSLLVSPRTEKPERATASSWVIPTTPTVRCKAKLPKSGFGELPAADRKYGTICTVSMRLNPRKTS